MAINLEPLPAWLDINERQAERCPLDLAATIQTARELGEHPIRVLDISTRGCLLALPGGTIVGRYATVNLPNGLAVEGWVAWSKDDRLGLDFARPLPTGVLAMLTHPQAAG